MITTSLRTKIEYELEDILLSCRYEVTLDELLKASQNAIIEKCPEVILYFTKNGYTGFTLEEVFDMISSTLDRISCRVQTYRELIEKKVKNYNRGLFCLSEVFDYVNNITTNTNHQYREICLKETVNQLTTKN